jgi:hypothetical protein
MGCRTVGSDLDPHRGQGTDHAPASVVFAIRISSGLICTGPIQVAAFQEIFGRTEHPFWSELSSRAARSIVGQFIVVDNRDQRLSVGAMRATIALVDGGVYQTLGLEEI